MGSKLSDFLKARSRIEEQASSRLVPDEAFSIETCPAERYLDSPTPWTLREQWPTAEAALDSLRAPSFEWGPTLMARTRQGLWEMSIGAFDAEGFVSLNAHSEVKKEHPWRSPGAGRFASTKSWPAAWRECQDARWMLRAANGVISRQSMTLAACACARTLLDLVPDDPRPLDSLEAAEGWARGRVSKDDIEPHVRRLFGIANSRASDSAGWTYASHVFYVFAYAVGTVSNSSYARDVPDLVEKIPRVGSNQASRKIEMAEVVRRAVPFRNVIEGLVGLRETP